MTAQPVQFPAHDCSRYAFHLANVRSVAEWSRVNRLVSTDVRSAGDRAGFHLQLSGAASPCHTVTCYRSDGHMPLPVDPTPH